MSSANTTSEPSYVSYPTSSEPQQSDRGTVSSANMSSAYDVRNPFNFEVPYMTPSSTFGTPPNAIMGPAQFGPFDMPSNPIVPWSMPMQHQQQQHGVYPHQLPQQSLEGSVPRARSFGAIEDMQWRFHQHNALGVHYSMTTEDNRLAPSSGAYQTPVQHDQWAEQRSAVGSATPPEQPAEPQQPIWTPLAPQPPGSAGKRMRDEEEDEAQPPFNRDLKRVPSTGSTGETFSDDEIYLCNLKQEGLPWKDIAAKISAREGKPKSAASLQMKYKRLRDRMRSWEPKDIEALRQAHEYWENKKWEIIANRMLVLGIQKKWDPRQCRQKALELALEGEPSASQGTAAQTPQSQSMDATPMSQYASPPMTSTAMPQFMSPPLATSSMAQYISSPMTTTAMPTTTQASEQPMSSMATTQFSNTHMTVTAMPEAGQEGLQYGFMPQY